MTIYSKIYTVPKNSTQEYDLEVEGDVITYVRLRFPWGPQMLLKIQMFYGEKQIFPYEEGTWFAGDGEVIQWDEYWELPETPCRIIIRAQNDDDTYDHSFALTVNVMKKENLPGQSIGRAIASRIKSLFGYV